jgi:hypothetical protein
MSEKENRDELKKMMRRHGGPGNPSIDKLEAEVRSDAFLPITRSPKVADLSNAKSSKVKSSGSHHVGTFVLEWGFDVPTDMVDDFHDWLTANEKKLAKCPSGVAYRGTFIATFGPANRPEGRYRTYWSLDELKNLESFAPGASGRRSAFNKALASFVSFRDVEKGTGYSQLYQVAAGTPQY